MRPSDFVVEVRDKTLTRLGQIEPRLLNLAVDLTDPVTAKGPSSWRLVLPRTHDLADDLLTEGSGLVITHVPTGRVISGPTSIPSDARSVTDPHGLLTLTGVTDDVLLWRRRAYPTPTAASTAQVDAYDVRTGAAETVMRAYVWANLGPDAQVARRVAGLSLAADGARGGSVKVSARFDVLGEILARLGALSGLRWRLVQVGSGLQFQVYEPGDRSSTVRLSLSAGTLATHAVDKSAPSVTHTIVMGQGEGADRTIVERTTAAAEAAVTAWGPWARSEVTIDQRNTDDPTELAQSGDKALAEGGGGTAVRLIPGDDQTMAWPETWDVADTIAVETDGAEPTVTVTSVTLRIDAAGVKVGAGVGNPPAANPLAAIKGDQAATDRRVEALERTAEAATPTPPPTPWVLPAGFMAPFAGGTVPDGFLLCDGQTVSRTTYADLYAALGGTASPWGQGDGSTTFQVPDLRDRVPIGPSPGHDLGEVAGERTHTLTLAEMPAHNHAGTGAGASYLAVGTTTGWTALTLAAGGSYGVSYAGVANMNKGSGAAHNNMPPYVAAPWMIKT